MHMSMSISSMASHFRIAAELWTMYMMMGPMSGKVTLSGPLFGTLLTLQPPKPVFEVHYKLMTACNLIL